MEAKMEALAGGQSVMEAALDAALTRDGRARMLKLLRLVRLGIGPLLRSATPSVRV